MAWHRRLASIALALIVAACGSSAESVSPSPSTASTPPPATPPSVTDAPPSGPSGTASDRLEADTVALVLTDDLRVRSKPGTSGKIAKQLLDAGLLVYVIEGPVKADGYDWLHVQPFGRSAAGLPSGWVAAGDKAGTAWVAPATVPCPKLPVDGPGLARTGPHTALACFRSQVLTFAARLVVPEAVCGLDPGTTAIDPDWLDPCSSGDLRLAAATNPSADDAMLAIVVDPASALPADLLVPQAQPASWPLLEISGQFGHPAAASCKPGGKALDATRQAELVFGCRLRFAVTRATPLAG